MMTITQALLSQIADRCPAGPTTLAEWTADQLNLLLQIDAAVAANERELHELQAKCPHYLTRPRSDPGPFVTWRECILCGGAI